MPKREGRWIADELEDQFFSDQRKQARRERKEATARDRSKYKKTDLTKRAPKQPEKPSGQRGRVTSVMSQEVVVRKDDQEFVCLIPGRMKKERHFEKTLVAVGDWVWFEEGVILQVEPRQTLLARADTLSRRRQQILAANITQVFVVASVITPKIKPALLDRYIIAAQKGGMKPVIVINKVDLLEEEDEEMESLLYEEVLEVYPKLNIPVFSLSCSTGEGIAALKEQMLGETSVFAGQSGVGKSSLINATLGLDLIVGETVRRTGKGSHTTTRAQLIQIDSKSWCIDTPGVQSFGVWDLERDEVARYFDEIIDYSAGCHFPNCSHTHEERCAIKEALEAGELSPLRYQSYITLLQECQEQHRRR